MGRRVLWEILVLVQFLFYFSYFCPDLQACHLFGKYTGSGNNHVVRSSYFRRIPMVSLPNRMNKHLLFSI